MLAGHVTGAPPRSRVTEATTDDGPAEGVGDDDPPTPDAGRATTGRWSPRMIQALLTAVLAVPLVVAVAVLSRPRWYPILDLAMTELRVRDVGSRHTPLIGLPGRIGSFDGERGSHPGPLSFWLLAPTYRLFGTSAWAMEVGTVALHTAAASTALWLARRRGQVALMVGVAALLALLMRSYGPEVLTQPWNPYLPVMWWTTLLLAVWRVLCRDVVALPVAVFAASFCAQTHVPYVGLTGGLAVLALLGVADAYRRGDGPERRRVLRWLGGSVALAAVLWSPVVVDQIRVDPGNLSLLVDHFSHPPEAPVGLRRGVQMVLLHLDPWRFLTGQGADVGTLVGASTAPSGSYLPGGAVLLAWGAAVVAAWRLRHEALLRLHLVVGVSLVLATYAVSRIFGLLWYYLMMWAWGITGLLLLAVAWTAVALVAQRSPRREGAVLWGRRGLAALVAVAVVAAAVFSARAARVEQPADDLSDQLAVVTPEIVAALADEDAPYRGRDERYIVTWRDTVNIGAQGIAMVNELERAGFDVGVLEPWWTVQVARHRHRPPEESTAALHLALGDTPVRDWRSRPGVEEIAAFDPRSPAQQEEFARVRQEVIEALRGEGLPDVAGLVDENLFLAAIDRRPSQASHDAIDRLLELGQPVVAFVGPPSMVG